jgi:hypothetical protein
MAISLALVASACMGGPLDETGSSGIEPVPGPEWVRCWIVPGEADELYCQWNEPSRGTPFPTTRIAVNADASGHIVYTEMLMAHPGEPVRVMSLAPATYPLKVVVQLVMGGPRPFGLDTLAYLVAPKTFASAADATAETPWIVSQPFSTWDVTLDVQTPTFDAWLWPTYVPLAPLLSPWTGATVVASGRLPAAAQGERVTLRFAVPAGTTTLAGDVRVAEEEARIPFVLDGPGAYVATATGISRVPPADTTIPPDGRPLPAE